MFNFTCTICSKDQKDVKRKYSISGFGYLDAVCGDYTFDSKSVCEKCHAGFLEALWRIYDDSMQIGGE